MSFSCSRSGNVPHMNGNNANRRPSNLHRNNSSSDNKAANSINSANGTPHDYIIKYVYDTWTAVNQEMDRNTSGSIKYYKEDNTNLKNFQPFDLEAFWGRRVVHYYQNQNRHN